MKKGKMKLYILSHLIIIATLWDSILILIAVILLQIKDYKLLEVKGWFKTNLLLFYAKSRLYSMIKEIGWYSATDGKHC